MSHSVAEILLISKKDHFATLGRKLSLRQVKQFWYQFYILFNVELFFFSVNRAWLHEVLVLKPNWFLWVSFSFGKFIWISFIEMLRLFGILPDKRIELKKKSNSFFEISDIDYIISWYDNISKPLTGELLTFESESFSWEIIKNENFVCFELPSS